MWKSSSGPGSVESFLFVASIVFVIRFCAGAEWTYDDKHGAYGPSNWKKLNAACGGSSQSPVNVVLKSTVYKSDIQSFAFEGYDVADNNTNYSLTNNGHTVQLSISNTNLGITKGGVNGRYKLLQFHAHWGKTNNVGSEHTIEGKSYPLELHFVHFSERFHNITEALKDPQGLAVIGVFCEIGEKNAALEGLVARFSSVKYKGDTTTNITPFKLRDLFPTNTEEFIRYSGSLTTPGCHESVVWTVLKNPIQISETQLNAFRTLSHASSTEQHDTPIQDNFRPVQKIGSRAVYRTFSAVLPPPAVAAAAADKLHIRRNGMAAITAVAMLSVLYPKSFS